jgi:hypothetical protein
MKLAAIIIGAAFAFVIVTVLIALGSDRLGLEHTIYLYKNLIDR